MTPHLKLPAVKAVYRAQIVSRSGNESLAVDEGQKYERFIEQKEVKCMVPKSHGASPNRDRRLED
jgi:hypothetical protein